jgi:hypothetical protein
MSDPVAAELSRLSSTVETLTHGLRMMVETQATQSEMLRVILEAATEEAGESPLPGLLTQLVERLDEQTGILHRIEMVAGGRFADGTLSEIEGNTGREPAGAAPRQ